MVQESEVQRIKQQLWLKEEELRKFSQYNDSHILALTHERDALKLEREQLKAQMVASTTVLEQELAALRQAVSDKDQVIQSFESQVTKPTAEIEGLKMIIQTQRLNMMEAQQKL